MVDIKSLLQRRTDLSTFLVHLTRAGQDGQSARQNLLSILNGDATDEASAIAARRPLGFARDYEPHLSGSSATQCVVCFTETPLEHIWMMLEDIDNRDMQFAPWGLATTKTAARKAGCNPVWYTNKSSEGWGKNPRTYVDKLIKDAASRCKVGDDIDSEKLRAEPIFRITPFIEDMGTSIDGVPKEFWWEREWRHVGDYHLTFPSRIVALLAPEDDHESFKAQLNELKLTLWAQRPLLDPRWGLEQMLATLAGVNNDYIGPFPD